MSDSPPTPSAAKRVARAAFAPVFRRIDAVRQELVDARERNDRLAAQVEQLSRQVERLEAYQHVTRETFERDMEAMVELLRVEVPVGDDVTPPVAMRLAFENVKLHAEAVGLQTRDLLDQQIADLRGTARLTQALAERAASGAGGADRPAGDGAMPPPAPTAQVHEYDHVTPSFDLLYRSFENRHRGSAEQIAALQREDYLQLLSELPSPELPVVDLGCGRGELVEVLSEGGAAAIGIDSNLGQVVERFGDDVASGADGEPTFVQADLFDWLDAREDGSCRAVVSMHVVEHLPLDLQVRLVFEAHRVLSPGGVLVLETPNTLSLSTAASNFWVDPTHQRPVHPLFLEFLASEAGFHGIQTRPLHPIPAQFPSVEGAGELVDALDSLLFGCGDSALVARR